jgi:hypothetical protein
MNKFVSKNNLKDIWRQICSIFLTKKDADKIYYKKNVIKLSTDIYGQTTNQNGTPVSTMVISEGDRELLKSGDTPVYLEYLYQNHNSGQPGVYYKGIVGGSISDNNNIITYPVWSKGNDYDYMLIHVNHNNGYTEVERKRYFTCDVNYVDYWYTENDEGYTCQFNLPKDFEVDDNNYNDDTGYYDYTIATRDWVEKRIKEIININQK